MFGHNWKTNLAALLPIIGALIAAFAPKYVSLEQQITTLLIGGGAGAGLLAAKDAGRKDG